VSNVSSAVAIGYRPQSDYTVTGTIAGNSLILHAPLSAFNLHPGSTLLSFASYSLAGPSDQVLSGAPETSQVFASMRTVDSSPPIDAVLAAAISPVPTANLGTPMQPGPTVPNLPNTTTAAPRDGVALVLSSLAIAVALGVGSRRRRRIDIP
jgi:hypothetical protein